MEGVKVCATVFEREGVVGVIRNNGNVCRCVSVGGTWVMEVR